MTRTGGGGAVAGGEAFVVAGSEGDAWGGGLEAVRWQERSSSTSELQLCDFL